MRDRRSHIFRLLAKTIGVLSLAAVQWFGIGAAAEDLPAGNSRQAVARLTAPQTTVIIFADRKMEDRQWSALFEALRRNEVEAAEESKAIEGTFELVRGDSMQPGLRVDTAIVVYLHGDCNLEPLPRRTAFGVRLGWVLRENGSIEPYAHVDCTRIGQVLGAQASGLDRDRRNAMMAGAMARVILHEWIHIAAQSPAHAKEGIAKAQFDVSDLLDDGPRPMARLR